MHTIPTSNGRSFETPPDESLLKAALCQGGVVDYSYPNARVMHGDTTSLPALTELTDVEVKRGWFLTCSDEATSKAARNIEVSAS